MSKVSVCIPSYNSAKYLKTAIDSVIGQKFTDFQLIIVDNNSTDNTQSLVAAYKDHRIRYIKNPRTVTMAENWNICVNAAEGKYVCLLHADDAFLPDMLSESVRVIDSDSEVGYVYSGVNFINDINEIVSVSLPFDENRISSGAEQFRKHVFGNYFYCPSVMVRRVCYERAGLFNVNISFAADWDMWLRIELAGYKVAYIAKVLSNYRYHGSSVSSTSGFLGSSEELTEHYVIIRDRLISNEFDALFSSRQSRELKDRVLLRFFLRFLKKRSIIFMKTKNLAILINEVLYIISALFREPKLHISLMFPIVVLGEMIETIKKVKTK